jgi:hypothetical protein
MKQLRYRADKFRKQGRLQEEELKDIINKIKEGDDIMKTNNVLKGECPSVSSPTIKIQLECCSNRSPEGISGDLKVCSAIKPFFYYFS